MHLIPWQGLHRDQVLAYCFQILKKSRGNIELNNYKLANKSNNMNSHLWQKIWQLDGFLNEKWYCKTKLISSYSMTRLQHFQLCSA